MLTNLFVIILFANHALSIQAASLNIAAGDEYLWGELSKVILLETDPDTGLTSTFTVMVEKDWNLEITDLRVSQKEYTGKWTDGTGFEAVTDHDYDWRELGYNFLAEDLFWADYEWDDDINTTVLVSFDFDYEPVYLIEPEWSDINPSMKSMFNLSHILDTVVYPDNTSIIYEFTLGSFLNDTSFSIMGKDTVDKAKKQFNYSNKKWTFLFDLSGIMLDVYFDGTEIVKKYFDSYVQTFEFEYSTNGVLQSITKEVESLSIQGDIKVETIVGYYFAIGGAKSVNANFDTIAALTGLFTISLVFVIIRKRR